MKAQLARVDQETRVAVDMALDRGGFRVVTDGEVRWCLEDARLWCTRSPFEDDDVVQFFMAPDAIPIRRIGRAELAQAYPPPEERLRGAGGVLVTVDPSLAVYGDTLWLNVVEWNAGLWTLNTETVFRDIDRELNPVLEAGTPARRIGYRLTGVDQAQRRLTIAAEYGKMGLITADEVRDVLDIEQKPTKRSRVPAHVQRHQPRLDGRRRS